MTVVGEWILIAGALAAVSGYLVVKWPNPRGWCLAGLILLAGAGSVWGWELHLRRRLASLASVQTVHTGQAGEFTGSTACRACHPDQYASWHQSYHRTMTQLASPETIRGKFDRVDLTFEGDVYHLERRGDEFWVDMVDPDWRVKQEAGVAANDPYLIHSTAAPRVQRRVSMVTGSHYMQAYWIDNAHGNQQLSLPFTYWFEQDRWVPRLAVFLMPPEKPGWAQVWNLGCVDCHATVGQPGKLPSNTSFDTKAAELGIACEACHGSASEHVKLNSAPGRRYKLHLTGNGDPSMVNPARLDSKRSSEICGRCHSIHVPFNDEEWTRTGTHFKPGEPLDKSVEVIRHMKVVESKRASYWSDDMVRVSGREFNGLLKTACYQKGEMSCLSCHSLHQGTRTYQLGRDMESNAACAKCHEKQVAHPEQHTHHATGSSGSLCYNCHMPYTTYGLMKGVRSHQISSPNVKTTVQTGRPDACNLCHLNQTLAWTGKKLAEWYKLPEEPLSPEQQTVAASILWATKGDAGQRALLAWHMGWEPARAVSGGDWMSPYLAVLLNDPYAAVRGIAGRSLKTQPGFSQFDYDYVAKPDSLRQASATALAAWLSAAKPLDNPTLLLRSDGKLDQTSLAALLKDRNNRSMSLNE